MLAGCHAFAAIRELAERPRDAEAAKACESARIDCSACFRGPCDFPVNSTPDPGRERMAPGKHYLPEIG
jgi:hypothetical protein